METPPFDDAFPIQDGDFSLLCIPNKYPLYKVYMALIIKGTTLGIPAFFPMGPAFSLFVWSIFRQDAPHRLIRK